MKSETEIRNWYEQRHQACGTDSWRPYEAYDPLLDKLGPLTPGGRFLDVGCGGTGFLLKAALNRGLDAWGIDHSLAGVKITRRVAPGTFSVVGNGQNLPFPDKLFDYLTCLGALEHFLDPGLGLQEMKRVLKDDGRLMIVVPNVNYFLWKLSGTPGTEQQEINEKLLSLADWSYLFSENGLKIIKVDRDDWPISKTRTSPAANPLKTAGRMLFRFAWKILPLSLTYQFVFRLKKK